MVKLCTIRSRKLCGNKKCKICFNKSFAIIDKSKFWHFIKNKINPWEVHKRKGKIKFWFICNICNHEFNSILDSVTAGHWCPFCKNQKLCNKNDCKSCYDKSFASHKKAKFWSNKNKFNPREVFKGSDKKCWFFCIKCNHHFDNRLADISSGDWCPYCRIGPRRLCSDEECLHCFNISFASHEKSKYWSDKNKLKPREVIKGTPKKFLFNCNYCNNEFKQSLHKINSNNRWCNICKNKTEKKLYNWLIKNYPSYKIMKEYKKNWCRNPETKCYLRYDFYIKELKLIIELDGIQHFKYVEFFNNNISDQQNRDLYKMLQAFKQNLSFIRIFQEDVLFNKNKWEEKLKKNIEIIKNSNNTMSLYIGNDNLYAILKKYDPYLIGYNYKNILKKLKI